MNATYKASIRTILWDRQNGRCCYCGHIMFSSNANLRKKCRKHGISRTTYRLRMATIEHLHRVTDGGTNKRDNLALACQECNTCRGTMDWLSYKSLKMGEIAA